ncbi:MAG TPA: UDP-glucose/GDP-mannose dehydrogenase family protein [Phycisphaerae bacterium]|nr:UDP-glucose/GDP-mannose dehydrogenase family protein [Phycisphaerae bacterium]
MRITIVGTGYVGLVTGVCLADTGNDVIGLDVDDDKVAKLSRGECTIFEPGLTDLLTANLAARRFRLTTNLVEAVQHAEIIFIAIGTPPNHDGSADLSGIFAAVQDIARAVTKRTVLVMKSTVPVGTCAQVEKLVTPLAKHPIAVVSNPEFLKEGSAVDDFQRPDRVVIGSEDAQAAEIMKELYAPFVRNRHPILVVRRAAAEMVKYAANCYLSTRISFINQIANICEAMAIDVDEVREGIGYDARIGSHFLYPGIGYGGSCFPKDVQALWHVANDANVPAEMLHQVHLLNERQKGLLVERIKSHFKGQLTGRSFAIWGAAFKPKTDDIREAPALRVIEGLLDAGAKVRISDPKALDNLRRVFSMKIEYCADAYQAAQGADALVICTEWNEYRSPDFDRLKAILKQPVIFDGRNLYKPDQIRRRGFAYYSIGRPPVV